MGETKAWIGSLLSAARNIELHQTVGQDSCSPPPSLTFPLCRDLPFFIQKGGAIMNQEAIEFLKECKGEPMGRREFVNRLAVLVGGTAAAAALLPFLQPGPAIAQVVAKDDPRLHTEYIQYPGETGGIRAYSARPKEEGKRPGVIVIHEIWGLHPHIEDVARRVALEGFLAIAPDALSPVGGTPPDKDQARSLMQKLDPEKNTKNYVAAVEYLKTHPQSTGKVGCMGFCWGGAVTNQVAVHSPSLTAAVPFYGSQPSQADVPRIKASMLIHYAGDDERINVGIPAFEAALQGASVDYQMFTYEGAAHAFFNDANPSRFHEEAARLAWERTVAFLKEKLKT
jgi:carboxymethylenebutenolidase